ncbi:MAG: type III pantothenate kinase [Hydrogenophilaceae bacterium]|nr:type III pantothenate kinase [Hydrogenophilaceae bacterium]
MILLIDAGNSRIKWGVFAAGQWREKDAAPTSDMAAVAQRWRDLNPAWAVISNVAGDGFAQLIGQTFQAGTRVFWLTPKAEAFGIRNHYSVPDSLGTDRYAALIAARQHGFGHVVVASLGTALTVDALTADGEFPGGMILPGYRAMLRSIEQATQGVRVGLGQWTAFPTNTSDAVETGIVSALVGAVEAQRDRLAARVGAEVAVLLTGGDAALIKSHLRRPVTLVEDLVLEGLLWVAKESGVADA